MAALLREQVQVFSFIVRMWCKRKANAYSAVFRRPHNATVCESPVYPIYPVLWVPFVDSSERNTPPFHHGCYVGHVTANVPNSTRGPVSRHVAWLFVSAWAKRSLNFSRHTSCGEGRIFNSKWNTSAACEVKASVQSRPGKHTVSRYFAELKWWPRMNSHWPSPSGS